MAKDHELRDYNNKLIGRIKTLPNGNLEIRDSRNVLKGIYDIKSNQTRDAYTRLIGKGNFLAKLL